MKTTLIILALFISFTAFSQNLKEVYKKENIKLVADESYAANNDWNKVFATYYDTIYKKPMGNRKHLHILPDGSAIVDHAYRNYYSKFSPTGKFEKEFTIVKSDGKPFKKVNQIAGVLDNNILYTGLDNMGNMLCFNFDGHYLKTLKLDYMSRQMIPLPNKKIAVVGWVIWAKKFRDFVAIVDYETNEEKIIWEHFTDRNDFGNKPMFNYGYTFEKRGAISFNSMPLSRSLGVRSRPIIASVGNNLIIGLPDSGELRKYTSDGKFIGTDKASWSNNALTVEEQKEIQQKAIADWKEKGISWIPYPEAKSEIVKGNAEILKKMEADLENIKSPILKPYFSTIIEDSNNNLLIFEYPEDESENKFNVYTYADGKFTQRSSFESDEYELVINSSKMVFKDGYMYGLQVLKEAEGVPLRLTKFKLN